MIRRVLLVQSGRLLAGNAAARIRLWDCALLCVGDRGARPCFVGDRVLCLILVDFDPLVVLSQSISEGLASIGGWVWSSRQSRGHVCFEIAVFDSGNYIVVCDERACCLGPVRTTWQVEHRI